MKIQYPSISRWIMRSALASCCALAFGAQAGAATLPSTTVPLSLGVNSGNGTQYDLDAGDYSKMTAAGATYIRTDLRWNEVERTKGSYDFSRFDGFVNTATANGKKVVIILNNSNGFYKVAPDTTNTIDTDSERNGFAAFAARAAARYTQPGVIFEIWNEPNGDDFWPGHNPDQYMALVNATVPAMLGANANCTIISGGVNELNWSQTIQWLRRCMELGLHTKVHAIGVHLYGGQAHNTRTERCIGEIQDVRNLVQRYGGPANFPIVNTEYGTRAEEYTGTAAEQRHKQAESYIRMYLVTLMCNVPINIWYEWRWRQGYSSHALLESSGTARTNHAAAAVLNTQLAGYAFEQRLNLAASHDYALVFKNGANRKLVVWTSISTAHAVSVPTSLASGSLATASMLGTAGTSPVSGNNISVSASTSPVYVNLGAATVSSVTGGDLLNDTFADGNAGNGTDARDGSWDNNAGLSISVSPFNTSGNTSNGMLFNVSGSSTEGWQTSRSNFETDDLQVGEAVKLKLDFRLAGSIINNSGMLRFALASILDTYTLTFGSGTSPGAGFSIFGYEATSGAATSVPIAGTPVAINDLNPHTVELTLTRTGAATLGISAKVDNNTFTGTAANVKNFGINRVRFGVGDTRNVNYDIRMDNIVVQRIPAAQPGTFVAAHDSTVRDGTYASTNQNGTTDVNLTTKNDATSYKREAYLLFDFAGHAGSVSNAVIRLSPTSTGMAGIQNQVALVSSTSWTEGGITWNTKPASSTILGTYTVTAGSPITINVTSQVQAAMSAGKKIAIRVYCSSAVSSTSNVGFASSENTDGNLRPVLTITP